MIRAARFAVAVIALLTASIPMAQDNANGPHIDHRSYQLGIMGGFAEVVKLGVKKLALSEVMSPAEMDDILEDALVIARRNGVEMWRETDFLVTDLYPATVAEGKHVLLIYTGDTLDQYLAIKADKTELLATGNYADSEREEIARRFGRLLSYPAAVIDDLLARQKTPTEFKN